MGKTKTAFVEENNKPVKSGSEKYEERRRKKEEEAAKLHMAESVKEPKEKVSVSEPEITVAAVKENVPIEEPKSETPEKESVKKPKIRGKQYKTARAKVDRNRNYAVPQAITLLKETSFSTFDGTAELHLVVKKEGYSANVTLPHSTGKQKRIKLVDDAVLEQLKAGKIDFDVLLATIDMMPKLVPFARLLGPRGLMPNPKNGTLIKNVKDVDKFAADAMTIKTEKKQPVIHTTAGKVSQKDKDLEENINAILDTIGRKQILKAYLKATMGPSIKLSL